jgi:methylase of polypeptide subunit release factors
MAGEPRRDPERPFDLSAPVDWERLRRRIEEAGYGAFAVQALDDASRPGGRFDRGLALRRTREATPFHTLVRLFLLGVEASAEAAAAALAPVSVEAAVASGLLLPGAGGVRAACMLLPFEAVLVPCDFEPRLGGGALRPDHVMGLGKSSLFLASLGVRRRVAAALDLGTGSGFHALLAAEHAGRVVGTDVSRRALAMAELARALNGAAHVELREGSLYEPVAGERFGWIAANPPFVISPRSRFVYRDSGRPGDELAREALVGACEHLEEGGFASVVLNWAHASEDTWDEPLRAWLRRRGCDAWLLRVRGFDPLSYASTWLGEAGATSGEQRERELDEWVAHLEACGIAQLSFGAVVLRRRAADANWIRSDVASDDVGAGPRSAQIERTFANQDLLLACEDDAALLARRLVLVPEHRLTYELVAEKGSFAVARATLRQTAGFSFQAQLDERLASFLAGCDGRRSLDGAVEALGSRIGARAADLRPACAAAMRQLLRAGLVEEALEAAPGGGAA